MSTLKTSKIVPLSSALTIDSTTTTVAGKLCAGGTAGDIPLAPLQVYGAASTAFGGTNRGLFLASNTTNSRQIQIGINDASQYGWIEGWVPASAAGFTLSISPSGANTTFGGNISVTGNLTVSGTDTWPQCVQTHYAAAASYSFTSTQTTGNSTRASTPWTYATNIAALNTTITPRSTNSKILVNFSFCGEPSGPDGQGENNVFFITRTISGATTEIGTASGALSGQPYGIRPALYDQNAASTMHNWHIMYLDSPATTSPVTYRLYFYNAMVDLARTTNFYLNRTITNSNEHTMERGSSQCILQEYFS